MAEPVLARALARWQHAAGPFWPYVCATPFLGLGEGAELVRTVGVDGRGAAGGRGAASALADRLIAAAGVDEPVAVLADLPIEETLRAAPLLVERGWYVVPVVQRWIASPAVLPCRRLIERLVGGARRVRRPASPRGVVLLADGERTGRAGAQYRPVGRAFDNRYEYQICRFPSATLLAAQGIERVRWVGRGTGTVGPVAGGPAASAGGPAPAVARDLAPYRDGLLRAGLVVDVVSW